MDNPGASFDIECPIHMGTLENARTMPCGHEFCSTCLIFVHARNRGKLVCPTCRYTMKLINVAQLPSGNTPSPTGSMTINHEKQMNKQADDFVQALIALKNVEKSCDETIEKLDEMTAELLGIKASSERKRRSLEDIIYEKDNQRGVPAADVCDFMQKSTQMLQNELFLQLHNHLPKFINAIDVYKGMEIPTFRFHADLAEKSDEIFKFACSLFLQLPVGEYNLLANSLARYLQGTLPDGDSRIWMVIAGEKGYWTSHDDYFSLDFGGTMIIGCPCSPANPIPTHKEEMEKFVVEQANEGLVQWKNGLCSNPTNFVQKQLQTETTLCWHVAAGDKGKFCAESAKPLITQSTVVIGDLCFVAWQS